MDLARPRPSEWIAGLAGLTLIVALFLPWYEAGDRSASGWGSLALIDVLLALAGLGSLILLGLVLARRSDATLIAVTSLATLVTIIATLLALIRLAVPADDAVGGGSTRAFGVLLATAAILVMLAALGFSMRNDRPRGRFGREGPPEPEVRDLGLPDPARGVPAPGPRTPSTESGA